ncbi:hypothetical protein [Mycolicibacterium aichiense]|uniref:hypothetical protein n=1 Tax=Mycolicibacterium aichiense TaxID=1799 RepID=UPI0011C082F3|nr:hypothetical protein [Mycolicibacterium aichiense]MCV7019144.1 hypothetical protein [Mycolicibacterium aichiense]
MTTTATYVTACHAVGYRHPDLTAHAAQIFEWYGGDDGLDLAVLDGDCAALRAASAAADQAVQASRDGLAAAAVAWAGESGSAADEFIQRHCAAGAAIAESLRAAVRSCEALRDGLWRAVDEKVGSAVSIDDRRGGERPAWLAAAATVLGGGAARDQAIDVVTHQITPYVNTDIRTDWLSAMRAAASSATAAYEDALRQLDSCPAPYFEVPGAFGGPSPVTAAPGAAHTAPAGAAPVISPSAAPTPPPSVAAPGPVDSPAFSPPADTPAAQPLLPPVGDAPVPPPVGTSPSAAMPTLPDVGGGLSGLVGQLADALAGMFDNMPGSAVDGESPGLDHPADEGEPEGVVKPEVAVPEDDPIVEESEPVGQPAEPRPPTPEADAVEAEPPPPLPASTPPAPPPVVEESEGQTPCEIAADELPQVGQ